MFTFDLITPIDGIQAILQVVYPSHEDCDSQLTTSLERLVETYNRRLYPSHLLFICPSGVEQRIKEAFNKSGDKFEKRLISASHVMVAPYDERGKLVRDQIVNLKSSAPDWPLDDDDLEHFGEQAVKRIFDETKTILHAPHGYVFRKPSGRKEDIFVRAGNMLREPSSLAVFNHLLLRKLPPNCSLVYIDSFTILSFALGLQSLVGHFRRLKDSIPSLTIENIHSYEITPEFRIPNEANYLVLISASTSGNLAKKLVDEKQADHARIVHLLGVSSLSNTFRDTCVYFRERPPSNRSRSVASQQNTLIEIGTEEFLVAQGPPRPVAITTNHVNTDVARILGEDFYRETLKFNELSPNDHCGYSMFSVSTERRNLRSSPICSWVRDSLVHKLPGSVRILIYIDDPLSARMASWLRKALGKHVTMKSLTQFKSQSYDDLLNGGSIVVVAHHDPDFEGLRESNIALRYTENVYRHYVIGYSFPSSLAEYKRHMTDLKMGPSGPQYGWSAFLVLPVGADPVHESLAQDHASLNADAVEKFRTELGNKLADAIIAWARYRPSKIPSDGLFLPRIDGTPLMLRHGSIFFPEANTDNLSQIVVYAMVAAAMQTAREPEVLSGRNSAMPTLGFDNNPFVRSVLDPSMFTRFSDGIIQAALLRAAQRSELDYSASEDLSRQFASICRSVLVSCNHAVGDAALEFVHALATKKVLLQQEDHDRLDQTIKDIPVLSAFNRFQKHQLENDDIAL